MSRYHQNISQYYTYEQDKLSYLFMPKSCWPITYCYDEPENVVVRATSTDDMEKAGQDTQSILNKTISSKQENFKYKADNLLEQARKMQDLSSATNNQLIWIAKYFSSGRWYRCYEYHACIRYRADE